MVLVTSRPLREQTIALQMPLPRFLDTLSCAKWDIMVVTRDSYSVGAFYTK